MVTRQGTTFSAFALGISMLLAFGLIFYAVGNSVGQHQTIKNAYEIIRSRS